MKTQCHLSPHSNVTWLSSQISHVPAKMRWWWICLSSTAICIAHYTARLDPCAWMGMGNWTRPGASSVQLLSLGRRSSAESGLKSAWDTWHYQPCLSANWQMWSPEAIGIHKPVPGSLCYACLFFRVRRRFGETAKLVFVWVTVECTAYTSMWSMRRE